MTKDSLTVAAVMAAPPRDVYAAWLDSAAHSKMTGGAASIDPTVGGKHSAWDGYIRGTTVALEPHARIVQTWRSNDFPADACDSRIEVTFEPHGEGARVVIVHTEIPLGQGESYHRGWQEHYFGPMADFFRATPDEWQPESSPETIRVEIPAPVVRARPKPVAKEAAKSVAKKPVAKASKKPVKKAAAKPVVAKRAAKKAPAKVAPKAAKKSAKPKRGASKRARA